MYSVYFSNNLAGKSAVTRSIYRNDASFFPAISFFMKIMGGRFVSILSRYRRAFDPPKKSHDAYREKMVAVIVL